MGSMVVVISHICMCLKGKNNAKLDMSFKTSFNYQPTFFQLLQQYRSFVNDLEFVLDTFHGGGIKRVLELFTYVYYLKV